MPVVLLGGRNGCGKEKAGTQCIQLSPEFGGHGIEVLGIFRAPGNHAAIHRIFPIDVDAIQAVLVDEIDDVVHEGRAIRRIAGQRPEKVG